MSTAYLEFCPRLKAMIDSGRSLDESGQEIEITGLSTLGNIRAIRELILQERCTRTLEVGLAYGASALTFLATLKEASPDDFHHSAIDPFQRKAWRGSSLKVIADEGFSDRFTFYEGYSSLVLPDLIRKGASFDLIYVDGSHLFEDVFLDFYFSAKLLKDGGLLLFDDCRDRHVLKVIKFIKSNYTEFLAEMDYRAVDDPHKPLIKKWGNALGIRQLCGFRKVAEPPRKWDSPLANF
jgi:predicted O-methyltransferase YrrM